MRIMSVMVAALLLSACARDMSSATYTSGASGGVAVEGVIVSAREVTVKDNDQLQNNSAGILAGGVAGGVAGNSVGKGHGNAAATVGGALAGAVLGALIQDQLGTGQGMEYIVKVSKSNLDDTSVAKSDRKYNKDKKASKVDVDTNLKTELVTVVQGRDQVFAVNQPVYVVYSDDRPRVIAR